MVAIYKDMFLADQWIRDAGPRQRMADTSYVYRPIIARHGYTEEDFRLSVDYYTDHPKEFATVFELVTESLKEDKKVLEARDRQAHARDSIARAKEALPFLRADFVTVPETDYYVAGLKLSVDSILHIFRIEPVNIFEIDSTSIAAPILEAEVAEEAAEDTTSAGVALPFKDNTIVPAEDVLPEKDVLSKEKPKHIKRRAND